MPFDKLILGTLIAERGDSRRADPFDLIQGLPVHPLVVHAAVVLIPITALGILLMAVSPRISRSLGWLISSCAAVALGAAFVAKESGEALEHRIGSPGNNHANLGELMPSIAASMLIIAPLLWFVDRRGLGSRRGVRVGLAVVGAAVALANLVWVYRVGESGARSVWSDQVSG